MQSNKFKRLLFTLQEVISRNDNVRGFKSVFKDFLNFFTDGDEISFVFYTMGLFESAFDHEREEIMNYLWQQFDDEKRHIAFSRFVADGKFDLALLFFIFPLNGDILKTIDNNKYMDRGLFFTNLPKFVRHNHEELSDPQIRFLELLSTRKLNIVERLY